MLAPGIHEVRQTVCMKSIGVRQGCLPAREQPIQPCHLLQSAGHVLKIETDHALHGNESMLPDCHGGELAHVIPSQR